MFSKEYLLIKNLNCEKKTNDLKYAIFWLLNNHINNNFDIQIDVIFTNYDNFVFETLKINENKLIKINNLVDSSNITTYSPFDYDYFNDLNLSLLYQKIYPGINVANNRNIKQVITQNISDNLLSNKNITSELPKNETSKNETSKHKLSEEELKKIDDDCNIRFEKMLERKEKEKQKEKYNIFISDISIYNKLTKEDNFSEDYLPPLYEAKYYIIKYLFKNEYFKDEHINEPSEELFNIYRCLYDFINNNDELNNFDDDIYKDVLDDFIDYLPDNIKLITDRQIMEELNKKSDNNDMFNEQNEFKNNDSDDSDKSDNSDNSDNSDESDDSDNSDDNSSEQMEKNLLNKCLTDYNNYNDFLNNEKNNENINENDKKRLNVIKFMIKEGYLEKNNIYESIEENIYLYDILCDVNNNNSIPDEIKNSFNDEINDFLKFIFE
jgi:hypothetical protein